MDLNFYIIKFCGISICLSMCNGQRKKWRIVRSRSREVLFISIIKERAWRIPESREIERGGDELEIDTVMILIK